MTSSVQAPGQAPPRPAPLPLSWTPNTDDYVNALTATQRRGHAPLLAQLLVAVLSPLTLLLISRGRLSVGLALAAALGTVQFALLMLPLSRRLAARALLQRHPELTDHIRAVIVPGVSVSVATHRRRALYRWDHIARIVRTRRCAVLFLRDGTILPIPWRSGVRADLLTDGADT